MPKFTIFNSCYINSDCEIETDNNDIRKGVCLTHNKQVSQNHKCSYNSLNIDKWHDIWIKTINEKVN